MGLLWVGAKRTEATGQTERGRHIVRRANSGMNAWSLGLSAVFTRKGLVGSTLDLRRVWWKGADLRSAIIG